MKFLKKSTRINYATPIVALILLVVIGLFTYFVSYNVNIHNYTFNFDKASYEYTGQQIKPKFVAKTKAGIKINMENYTVDYIDDTEVGTGTVTLTNKNKLFDIGKAKGQFKIVPAAIKNARITSSKAYPNGKYKFDIEYNGMKLEEGKDYAVKFNKDTLTPGDINIFELKGIGKHYQSTTKVNVLTAPNTINKTDLIVSTSSTISIQWDKDNDNVKYDIFRCNQSGNDAYLISTVDKNTYTFKELPHSTYIYYYIRPFIELNGQKLYAEGKKVLSQHTTAPEIIIKGVSRSGSTVSIYWKTENCKSYEVQYSNDKSFSNARTVTTTKNNITMKNMSNPCYVRVKCVTNDSKIIGYWSQAQKV